MNLTEPTLHPGLRNSLGHQLILTISTYLSYLVVKASKLNSGLWSNWLAMESALAFSKQAVWTGRQVESIGT